MFGWSASSLWDLDQVRGTHMYNKLLIFSADLYNKIGVMGALVLL